MNTVMPRIHDPQRPPGSRVRCKSKRAFIRASSSSIPYLHWHSGEIPGRERVSKAQRFSRGLGPGGEVMAVASADWLGKGRGLGRLAGKGSEFCYAGRWACFDQEAWMGEREVTQGEEAWSRWRTQNKMESAGVGPPFQYPTVIPLYHAFLF